MVYLEGNHSNRIERYIDANPACEGMLEVEKVLNLTKRRIEWVRSWSQGELFELGNCALHHGLYCNDHHAKKMVQRFNRNILYGHTHDVQTYSSHGHTASDVLIGGSLGCLCKIPQKYLKGGPTRWQHCVTVFEFDTVTGEFWFTPIRINDGRLIYNGRVFGG